MKLPIRPLLFALPLLPVSLAAQQTYQLGTSGTPHEVGGVGTFLWSTWSVDGEIVPRPWDPSVPGSVAGDTVEMLIRAGSILSGEVGWNIEEDRTMKGLRFVVVNPFNARFGNDNPKKTITFDSGEADVPATLHTSRLANLFMLRFFFDANMNLASNLEVTHDRLNVQANRESGIAGVISGPGKLTIGFTNPNSPSDSTSSIYSFGPPALVAAQGVATSAPNTHSGGTTITGPNAIYSFLMRKPNALGTGPLHLTTAKIDLNLFDQTVGGLEGGTNSKILARGGAGITTLTLDFPTASRTFSGIIENGATRTVALAKAGAGTQTLTGVHTYSGPTTVNGGTLALAEAASIAQSATVTVNQGGILDVSALADGFLSVPVGQTLAGTGTLVGDAQVLGTVAPGNPYGTLTAADDLSLNAGSSLNIDINVTGVPQVETATASGVALEDGKVLVTVTGAGIAGSPLGFEVDVELFDEEPGWAANIRAALAASPAITALYQVGGSGAAISLTRLVGAANDPTLNIAIDNGDPSPEITPAPLSANTTPGVGPGADRLAVAGELVIDGATLDLNIAGTPDAPAYVIATYGSRTGTFASVNGLPAGYSLNYHYNSGTAIALVEGGAPPLSPFEEWISGFSVGGQTAAGNDPDGDGAPNFMEFALGSDPSDPTSQARVFVKLATVDATADVLTLTAAVRSSATFAADGNNQKAVVGADQLTYHIEAAATLDDWGSQAVTLVTGADAAAIQAGLPDPSAGWTYRTFRSSGSAVGDPRKFIRLRVTTP